jgi:Cu(I)/Ag(I) efflux system membrane fusion protein
MTRVVLAEGDGKYRSARINVGREAGESVEVLEGLTLGESVVTSAHFMLDSESSQSADLSRINGTEPPADTVWAQGEITDVMAGHRMLTINHQAVPEWQWPGMVMKFTVADQLNMQELKSGQAIEFEMQKTPEGQYQIVDYRVGDSVVANEVWVSGDITMLMADFGMITLQHLPVAEWDWQAGEMNFSVGDEVDLSGFEEGQKVRFLVEKQGADYLLKQITVSEESV